VVASTFKAILNTVATAARRGAKIYLNELVVAVKNLPSSSPTILVTTANGKIYKFDAVVVTIPLGWLKTNRTSFEPRLPSELTDAISAISVGHLEKVYIKFPRAFWRSDIANPADSPAEETRDSHPGYTNWIAPSYASDTNPNV
jgi:monoamine oxidase